MSDLDTNNYFNTVYRFCARGVRHVGRENLDSTAIPATLAG